MKAKYISPLLVLGVLSATAACDGLLDPRDHTYDGPPVLEFAPVIPAGNYTRSVSFAAGSTAVASVQVGVQYIGETPSSPVSGEVAIGDGTTAVENTHYTLPSTSQFSIPAGGHRTDVPVQIDGSALADGEAVTLVLDLVGSGGVDVNPNYSRFTIQVSKAAS